MRSILHGDLRAAAIYARDLPPARRGPALAALLDRAHCADRYRKRLGRVHPLWGDGTLWAAVPRPPVGLAEPFLSDQAYLESMLEVFQAILCWKERQARPPLRRRGNGLS